MRSNEDRHANQSAEVAIVGGGVIGLSIARALTRRGMRDVVVIERQECGREASWAAGGILAPQIEADASDDFFRLGCASRDLYPQFAAELQAESGIDVELDTTGTMSVAFSEDEEAELRHRIEWQRTQGLRVEWLTGDKARAVEPRLSTNVRSALSFPNDYQVDNRKLVEALVIANQRHGVRLITGCGVRKIQISDGAVTGIQTELGFLSAKRIVIAAGAWSSLIQAAEALLPRLEIEPIRGQMLCFNAPGFARHVIYSSRGYIIPRRDGRLLAGSTSEHVGFDKRVTEAGVETILSLAIEITPALQNISIADSWAGFRPRAKDDLPVLGSVADVKGLFYATGHYRNGILLAPITGEVIAEAILDDSPKWTAFSPQRFATEARP
ncbi:MAG TPA: glycine oxidase ThiO [Pyrinomonadaceae bacterium]|nr:glycine oxidase ThiO [Pyrinomonadaceae bacterium]